MHEAAHIFHNCKRGTVGLPETRKKEWLLDIAFNQRETFAYSCENYSRILEQSENRKKRIDLAERAVAQFIPPDASVDMEKFHAALRAAARAQNGWKRF